MQSFRNWYIKASNKPLADITAQKLLTLCNVYSKRLLKITKHGHAEYAVLFNCRVDRMSKKVDVLAYRNRPEVVSSLNENLKKSR